MRIAVVEDNDLLRENLAQMLAKMPGCVVKASYQTAEAALADLRPRGVDLLIVDIELPGMSGIELIRRLCDEGRHIPALVWTIHEDREVVYAALKAGAVGYLLKGCKADELASSLRHVAEGGAPISPNIARRLIQEFVMGSGAPPAIDLTQREREVLRAVAAGYCYKEIAANLKLSAHTVHTHIKHIYAKLQAKNRSEALRHAQQIGLVVRR